MTITIELADGIENQHLHGPPPIVQAVHNPSLLDGGVWNAAMRHRKDGPWITTGSILLLLVMVAGFEMLVLTSLPGTHFLPSHSSLGALFRAWR